MEGHTSESNSKKRLRDDSGLDESKRARSDSEINSPESKRVDSEVSELNSPEAREIKYDILDILDDPDMVTDRDPEIHDLDSVIKSFEEEIFHPAPESDPGELGYLLEASDDELGLPPAISHSDDQQKNQFPDIIPKLPSDPLGFDESLGFENELPSYDSFGFGFGEETEGSNDANNAEFVTLGGLFDSDFSEFSWRPESLPAL